MMRLPRPASPKALWADLKAVLGSRSPHHLLAATLALAIPIGIFTVFALDRVDAGETPSQIIYVESWPLDRPVEATIAKQNEDEQRRQEWEKQRRESFQRLDDSLNKMGI